MKFAASILLTLFLPFVALAQNSDSGAIEGKVIDEQGETLIGITVMLQEINKGTATDTAGYFNIKDIPAGNYMLKVSGIGFKTLKKSVKIVPGVTKTLEIILSDDTSELGEITIEAESEATIKERSAEAIEVVELTGEKIKSADLGEVLSRTQGVSVRRGGGLGSDTRFSLAGLTDDKIRFFLDGIPLEQSGFPFGIANVSVNLIEQVEIYRGVVPIRFGADALGGAVNLVTDDEVSGTRGSASFQTGSFGTHRLTLGGRHHNKSNGFYIRANGFFDRSKNDYEVNIQVPDPSPENRGQLIPAQADRFNDAYRAGGGSVEIGFVDKGWAKNISLRLFGSDFNKEFQSNRTMTRPYGEVEFGGQSFGGTVRFEQTPAQNISLDILGGYTYSTTEFLDVSSCIYNWFGECVRERQQRGEINPGDPRDETLFEQAGFVRFNTSWEFNENQTFRISLAPTMVIRDGEDRIREDGEFSSITADRTLFTAVSGIEHQLTLFNERLENIAFFKNYLQRAESIDPVTGGGNSKLNRNRIKVGFGNSFRYRFSEQVYLKASYEYATRLPRADEIFGDAIDTNANLELEPEVSHNVNLGLTWYVNSTGFGSWRNEVNSFLRETDDLILVLPSRGDRFRNENVFSARSVGVEASTQWTSTRNYLNITGNLTYIDFRNQTDTGPFAPFDGDRIPNRPYLFTNGAVEVHAPGSMFTQGDRMTLSWNTRFVNEFFEFWESAGVRDSKRIIPGQNLHALALTYRVAQQKNIYNFTVEAANITDAKTFDFFGAQRPGRAFFFKTTVEF